MSLMPSEIVDEVRDVLQNANRGKGTQPTFLTAYQILERLPKPIKDRLNQERTGAGKGTGVYYGAASVVSDAAEVLERRGLVEVAYLDCSGIEIKGTQPVVPSFGVCGLYRAKA